jgi:radical SAM protein with 4Fe4S-binding SPASM domain
MSMELFSHILDQADPVSTAVKVFGLGEPALHPEIDAMMSALRDRGFRTLLYTNGTLFERVPAATILSWKLSTLIVSVDGVDARSFARLRVGGDYEKLRADVRAFRKAAAWSRVRSPLIEVRHVIMPNETDDELRRFRRTWKRVGADTVKYNALLLPYSKYRKIDDTGRKPCRDILREMHIRYDGRVPMCGYEGHREWIGDLTSKPLTEVWNSERLNEVRDLHRAKDLRSLPSCQTCQFR